MYYWGCRNIIQSYSEVGQVDSSCTMNTETNLDNLHFAGTVHGESS